LELQHLVKAAGRDEARKSQVLRCILACWWKQFIIQQWMNTLSLCYFNAGRGNLM
jgi:hypothetical protein